MTVAALFVAEDGAYADDPRFDAWTETRDARLYDGEDPVVAHPPCERWGRFAKGSPTAQRFEIGDDGGCFEAALAAVRRCGGVIEHPQGSHAWRWFGLPRPKGKGWTPPDEHGGRSCYIDQGAYGHPAKKPTWLYAVLPEFPDLDWTRVWGRPGLGGDGVHSARERARKKARHDYKPRPQVEPKWRYLTPPLLKEALFLMAESARHGRPTERAPPQVQLSEFGRRSA